MRPERYQKKPVVIEAVHYDGTEEAAHEIEAWASSKSVIIGDGEAKGVVRIATSEGVMTASPGDWIIRGIKGEFYPCKPDIFAATYQPAAASVADHRQVDHAQKAYDGYAGYTGGKTFDGRDMPRWLDLPPRIRNAWRAAIAASRGEELGPLERED